MYFVVPRNHRAGHNEVQGLRRALDRVYGRLRERARAQWERHHAGPEPADACVSVRINGKGWRPVAG